MYEITRLLLRRWRTVAVIAVVVAVLGIAAVVVGGDTTYTAQGRVILDQPDLLPTQNGAGVPQKLATLGPTFCALLASDDAKAAIEDLAGAPGPVRCVPVEGTTLLAVVSETSDPDRARQLASAGASVLTEVIEQRYGTRSQDLPADAPAAPATPDGSGAQQPVPPSATRPFDITAEVLVEPVTPGADPDRSGRQVILVLVAGLMAGAAFAVAAEPHRRDAPPAATEDPRIRLRARPPAR